MLKTWSAFATDFQKQFILHSPSSFIYFLSECVHNLVQGNVDSVRKSQVEKLEPQIVKLCRKKTSLRQRRLILASRKGLVLIKILAGPVLEKFGYGAVCSNTRNAVEKTSV